MNKKIFQINWIKLVNYYFYLNNSVGRTQKDQIAFALVTSNLREYHDLQKSVSEWLGLCLGGRGEYGAGISLRDDEIFAPRRGESPSRSFGIVFRIYYL